MIVSVINILLLMAATIMSWWIFFWHKNTTWLTFSIFATLSLAVAVFISYWAYTSVAAIHNNKNPNSTFNMLAYMFGIIFGAYTICATFALYLYRYWHYSYLLMAYGDDPTRNDLFGSDTFASFWVLNKSMILAISLCLFFSAFCFAYSVYSTYTLTFNRYQLTR
jgi:hypothetical protein